MTERRSPEALRAFIVGHDGFRGGSQLHLLNLLRYFRSAPETNIDCEVLLLGGGELVPEFQSEWPTTVLDRRPTPFMPAGRPAIRHVASLENALLTPVRGRLSRRAALRRVTRAGPFDVMLLNSLESLPIVSVLQPLVPPYPMVCHVHELASRIHDNVFARTSPHIDRFIAVSEAVSRHLTARGIDPTRISVVYPGIRNPAHVPSPEPGFVRRVRQSLGIPDSAFVVGGCGTLHWRKGPDIFVQVAAALARTVSDTAPHFVWIGGDLSGLLAAQLRFDAERLGVSDLVHFVGATPDPYRYMSIFDVFFLSSREDPFPAVTLEAASLGVPSLSFAESGGTREFVGADAGLVVPYLDVAAAAAAIRRLATMPNLRADLGRHAKAKVAPYSIDAMATRLLDVLRMVARQAREAR